jgi:hypothetical protein
MAMPGRRPASFRACLVLGASVLAVPVLAAVVTAVPATSAAAAHAASSSGAASSVTSAARAARNDALALISCTRAFWCMATGTFISSSGKHRAFAEQWKGGMWRRLPNPPGKAPAALSCATRSFCMANGGPTRSRGPACRCAGSAAAAVPPACSWLRPETARGSWSLGTASGGICGTRRPISAPATRRAPAVSVKSPAAVRRTALPSARRR